jgi:hypothetical protein
MEMVMLVAMGWVMLVMRRSDVDNNYILLYLDCSVIYFMILDFLEWHRKCV